jgi:hypothetical protein
MPAKSVLTPPAAPAPVVWPRPETPETPLMPDKPLIAPMGEVMVVTSRG